MATKPPTPAPTRKPSTMFTKEYVEARIEARQASLRSRIDKLTEEIDDYNLREEGHVAAFKDEVSDIVNTYLNYVQQYAVAKTPSERADARHLISAYTHEMTPKAFDYREQTARENIIRQREQYQKELVLLDHAAAYFKESPVEAYSTTSLRQLGLLDVVKFAIAPTP